MRSLGTAALAALLGAGCGGSGADPAQVDSAVLLVIDTLRADDAYDPQVAPHLATLGERSVVFERAYSSASYTLASTATLFTGLRPAAHVNLGEQTNVLQPAHRTLAEALSEAGVATAAFSCNPHISRPGGFDQGFDDFGFYGRDTFEEHRVPAAVADDLLLWWREHDTQSRFAYVHVLPPHAPYQAPLAFRQARGAGNIDLERGLQARLEALNDAGPIAPGDPRVGELRDLYRASVLYVDDWANGLHQRLLVESGGEGLGWIVTSDHGEGFMEHGRLSHGFTPHDEQVRVPLIWSWPGLEPRREPGPVETRDLAASLCEAFGATWPAEDHGRGWWSALVAGESVAGAPAVLSRSMGRNPGWAWRTARWTTIYQSKSGVLLHYDARQDPLELDEVTSKLGDDSESLRELSLFKDDIEAALAHDQSLRVPIEAPRFHTVFAKELAALGYLANPEDGERIAPGQDDE
ncbi:MAG: sulfatase [Planctomycetota bacterium]|jgi:arylsulfatase A-like enzyme